MVLRLLVFSFCLSFAYDHILLDSKQKSCRPNGGVSTVEKLSFSCGRINCHRHDDCLLSIFLITFDNKGKLPQSSILDSLSLLKYILIIPFIISTFEEKKPQPPFFDSLSLLKHILIPTLAQAI